MSQLVLNQNQFAQTPMLGQVSQLPNPNIIPVLINPASAATVINAGSAMKLITGASGQIMVDVCTAVTDGPVFGFIPYNMRKNSYAPGDVCELACQDSVITLSSGAAIARGAEVAAVPASAGNDPTVLTAVATNFVAGRALDRATAAAQLIRVIVTPTRVVI